jgi:hypothetical protein
MQNMYSLMITGNKDKRDALWNNSIIMEMKFDSHLFQQYTNIGELTCNILIVTARLTKSH